MPASCNIRVSLSLDFRGAQAITRITRFEFFDNLLDGRKRGDVRNRIYAQANVF
jgi:hypothetical protein